MNVRVARKFLIHIGCICTLLFVNRANAQKQLSGTIKDAKGTSILHAGVSLKNSRGYVLAFNQSNLEGRYVLALPDTPAIQHLLLEVYVLGYKKVTLPLQEGKLSYNFVLEEQLIDLKEVEVKKRPQIISIGDTLSYDVASFSQPEDRSIGDVIRRLPGITVADNGQISYNGKIISNLFIHGDDLMDGKYGLATRVITKEMIKSVDVIQNHQPIKVLQNKVFTDDVAMNLVLKDENSIKLGGQAMLGGGLPEQYDVALNGMMFNKVFKMLNSLQVNNSGLDYRNDFEQLGTAFGAGNAGGTMPKALLSATTIGNPDLPKTNYYFNKSGVFNGNNLYNLKSGLQLKSNIQLFLDRNTMLYQSSLSNYLPNDTVNYQEEQYNASKPKRLNVALTAIQNKQRYFLHNKLSVNLAGENKHSYLNFNGNSFNQYLDDVSRQFSNDFSFTPAVKNGDVIDFRWHISYFENPQTLAIDTGLNAAVLNNNLPYQELRQNAKIPTLLSNIVMSYRVLNAGKIKHNYQLGMVNERQELASEMKLIQADGTINNYAGDVGNKLKWGRDRFFANAEYSIRNEMWEAGLSVPLSLQSIRYRQNEYQLDEDRLQFLFNPSANFRKFFNAEDYLKFSYSYLNLIGDISSVYRGALLVNYRALTANNAALLQRDVHTTSLYYNFQRSVIMLFINAALSHKKIEANSILSSVIDNNIQQTVLLPIRNQQDVISASVGLSKYIFALAATVKLKGNWERSRYDQFLNDTRLPFNNYSQSLSFGLDSKPFGKISIDYRGIVGYNKSRPVNVADESLTNSALRIEQGVNLGCSPIKNLNLNVEGKTVYSTQANINNLNYFFLNARLRYKIVKWRTDLSFDITNLMNEKRYELLYLSSNQFAINSYELRGRMGILRLTFVL